MLTWPAAAVVAAEAAVAVAKAGVVVVAAEAAAAVVAAAAAVVVVKAVEAVEAAAVLHFRCQLSGKAPNQFRMRIPSRSRLSWMGITLSRSPEFRQTYSTQSGWAAAVVAAVVASDAVVAAEDAMEAAGVVATEVVLEAVRPQPGRPPERPMLTL